MADAADAAPIKSLITCPACNREMRLFGVEPENDKRDLFTFECTQCGRMEVRGVLVT